MKKSLLILGALSLSISGISQAAGQMNEQVLREKAAFALGVTQDRVTLEQSDRTPEPNSYFFMPVIRGNCISVTLAPFSSRSCLTPSVVQPMVQIYPVNAGKPDGTIASTAKIETAPERSSSPPGKHIRYLLL